MFHVKHDRFKFAGKSFTHSSFPKWYLRNLLLGLGL